MFATIFMQNMWFAAATQLLRGTDYLSRETMDYRLQTPSPPTFLFLLSEILLKCVLLESFL